MDGARGVADSAPRTTVLREGPGRSRVEDSRREGSAMGAVPADGLVFYGATGDRADKKIFPALHGMTLHGNLPKRVIAVAKSGWTLDQLRARAFESIERSGVLVREVFDTFAASLTYIDGDYGDAATFNQLSEALGDCVCPVHYLAIPPRLFCP